MERGAHRVGHGRHATGRRILGWCQNGVTQCLDFPACCAHSSSCRSWSSPERAPRPGGGRVTYPCSLAVRFAVRGVARRRIASHGRTGQPSRGLVEPEAGVVFAGMQLKPARSARLGDESEPPVGERFRQGSWVRRPGRSWRRYRTREVQRPPVRPFGAARARRTPGDGFVVEPELEGAAPGRRPAEQPAVEVRGAVRVGGLEVEP